MNSKPLGKSIQELLGKQPPERATVMELQSRLLQRRKKVKEELTSCSLRRLDQDKSISKNDTLGDITNSTFKVLPKPIVPFVAAKTFLRDGVAVKERVTLNIHERIPKTRERELARRSVKYLEKAGESKPLNSLMKTHERRILPSLSYHTENNSANLSPANRESTQSKHTFNRLVKSINSSKKIKNTQKQKTLDRTSQKISYLSDTFEGVLYEELPMELFEEPQKGSQAKSNQQSTLDRDSTYIEQCSPAETELAKRSSVASFRARGSRQSVKFGSMLISRWESNEQLAQQQHIPRKKSQFHKHTEDNHGHNISNRSLIELEEEPMPKSTKHHEDDAIKLKPNARITRKLKEEVRDSAARSHRKRNIEPIGIIDQVSMAARRDRSDTNALDVSVQDVDQIKQNSLSKGLHEPSVYLPDWLLAPGERNSSRIEKLERIKSFLDRSDEKKKTLKKDLRNLIERFLRQIPRQFSGSSLDRQQDQAFIKELLAMLTSDQAMPDSINREFVMIEKGTGQYGDWINQPTQIEYPTGKTLSNKLSGTVISTHEIRAKVEKMVISHPYKETLQVIHENDDLHQSGYTDVADTYNVRVIKPQGYNDWPTQSCLRSGKSVRQLDSHCQRLKDFLLRVRTSYPDFWQTLIQVRLA